MEIIIPCILIQSQAIPSIGIKSTLLTPFLELDPTPNFQVKNALAHLSAQQSFQWILFSCSNLSA